MASNNNIFCVSNPAKILDGLWQIMNESGVDLTNMVIFVPSRRAVRNVEKMIVQKIGHAAFLPKIVPLGEGFETEEDADEENTSLGVVSNLERVVTMAHLLSKVEYIGSLSAALPVAHTLVTMQDYLENVGKKLSDIDLENIMKEIYAEHFQYKKELPKHLEDKARLLGLIGKCENEIFAGRETETENRNKAILGWVDYINKMDSKKSLVIVCGSTASVMVTRNLMKVIANLPFGRIILSGKIFGEEKDFMLETNPYHSEYEFLNELGLTAKDVREIDLGQSNIDFMNVAFGNNPNVEKPRDLENCHLVECRNEAQEAASVAEIAKQSIDNGKTVLIITPDKAANTRLKAEFDYRGIVADFSSGISGDMTLAGRALLILFDDWIEKQDKKFDEFYAESGFNLFDTIAAIVDKYFYKMEPQFNSGEYAQLWVALKNLSDYVEKQNITLNVYDARALLADCFSGVSVRGAKNENAKVIVLGNIESRMQTADVVILTGLNEGMFPSLGYSNPWLARSVADKIGLPSPEHKVSLMALDFMNLSCNPCVYWVRSIISGGAEAQESRFISRVIVLCGALKEESEKMVIDYRDVDISKGKDILKSIAKRDEVEPKLLDYSWPNPPRDWSDVYVTWLERWINNPYLFYVEHILNLEQKPNYWEEIGFGDFGNLVHRVLQDATCDDTVETLVAKMDALAEKRVNKNSLMFSFWHKRFEELAPKALEMICETPGAKTETRGKIEFKVGDAVRVVRAKADRIWDGGVLDIKTGYAPDGGDLKKGTKPQLPLEALMLVHNGFEDLQTTEKSQNPTMEFLQLKAHNISREKYNIEDTKTAMIAAEQKVQELFNMYSAGNIPYKYYEEVDSSYKQYTDFARTDERDD